RFLLLGAELRLDRVIEASAQLSTAGSFRTRSLADQGPMNQNTGGILIATASHPAGTDMLAIGERFLLWSAAGIAGLSGLMCRGENSTYQPPASSALQDSIFRNVHGAVLRISRFNPRLWRPPAAVMPRTLRDSVASIPYVRTSRFVV